MNETFKIGDRVIIKMENKDVHLHNQLGVICEINERECYVYIHNYAYCAWLSVNIIKLQEGDK